jgi:membrane associated rhomboid family serine protease
MIIIPVFNKAKSTIPSVCIALILINAFVYFYIQSGDSQIHEEAGAYYESSGLLHLELEAYLDYLRAGGDTIAENALENEKSRSRYLQRMFSDGEFHQRLADNRVITPQHHKFTEWREKRDTFEEIKHRSVISRYGYSPKENNIIGLFTCIFLHGGTMHLIGNMVFLWLVGAVLEKAVGAPLFLILYCLCGICASALFGLVYPLTPGPLVGASGAIAGLMGAYGIIFALRKIRVFYSLGFYFNYAVVPAISLFPIWLINEVFQLYSNQGSNVAYMAHIGGLVSGLAIGTGYRILMKERIEILFHREEKENKLEEMLDSGMQKLVALDMENARKDFSRALKIDPRNRSAIRQLFDIDKISPQAEEFHRSAHRLLHSISRDNRDEYLQVFEEYRAAAKKPRVTMDILERLSYCHLVAGNFDMAAGCVAAMLKRSPENGKIPGFLHKLAHGFLGTDKPVEAMKCYRILSTKYTESSEGIEATEYLKNS